MTTDHACDGRIRPSFVLLISGKVRLQWLEIQRIEKPFSLLAFTAWFYKPVSGKTAYLVQFVHEALLVSFPLP